MPFDDSASRGQFHGDMVLDTYRIKISVDTRYAQYHFCTLTIKYLRGIIIKLHFLQEKKKRKTNSTTPCYSYTLNLRPRNTTVLVPRLTTTEAPDDELDEKPEVNPVASGVYSTPRGPWCSSSTEARGGEEPARYSEGAEGGAEGEARARTRGRRPDSDQGFPWWKPLLPPGPKREEPRLLVLLLLGCTMAATGAW
jgi:hypothetical protein